MKDPFADIGKKPVKKAPSKAKADPFFDIGKNPLKIVDEGKREYTDEEKRASKESRETYVDAPLMGALSGATMGYGERVFPEYAERLKEENPISSGVGYLAGALAPGAAIAKGVGAVGKLSGLTSLARSGVRQGATTGLIEGLVADPGEDGDRTTRGIVSSLLGGASGLGSRLVSTWGRQSQVYDEMGKPGFAKGVEGEISDALERLIEKQVKPKKAALNEILDKSEAVMEINPEVLKGFTREAPLRMGRQSGGFDRLAELLEGKYGDKSVGALTGMGVDVPKKPTRAPISAKNAQRLKERFDEMAGYARSKPYGNDVNPKEVGAYARASKFRNFLSEIDPRVDELNESMSDALRLRKNVQESSKSGPIELLTADPSGSRGQQILDLDELAGTKLAQRGQDIAEAKRLRTRPENMVGLEAMKNILRAGKRGIGKYAGPVESKMPIGTKEALILKLLDSTKSSSGEEE